MLTEIEKQKIALLRNRFQDDEWDQLRSSDEYARERIAFYSSSEIQNIANQLEMLHAQKVSLDRSIILFSDKLNILTST